MEGLSILGSSEGLKFSAWTCCDLYLLICWYSTNHYVFVTDEMLKKDGAKLPDLCWLWENQASKFHKITEIMLGCFIIVISPYMFRDTKRKN